MKNQDLLREVFFASLRSQRRLVVVMTLYLKRKIVKKQLKRLISILTSMLFLKTATSCHA